MAYNTCIYIMEGGIEKIPLDLELSLKNMNPMGVSSQERCYLSKVNDPPSPPPHQDGPLARPVIPISWQPC